MDTELIRGDSKTVYVIEKADVSDAEEIVEHIVENFPAHEPLCVSLKITRKESVDWFSGMVTSSLGDNLTYVARLRGMGGVAGRIIGVRLCCAQNRPNTDSGTSSPDTLSSPRNSSPNFEKIGKLLNYLEDKMWNLLPVGIDRLVSLSILSVEPKFVRMGIGRELVEVGDEDARQKGYHGVITEATAFTSRKIFEKLNYKRLTEVLYAEWLDEDGNRVFNCADPNNDRATLEFKAFQ